MPRLPKLHASPASAVLALYAAVLLVAALWLPWWRMECRAPQYGQRVLVVSVSPTTVSGDVKEIDGLGHYVGMMPLAGLAPLERRLSPFAVALVALIALVLPFVKRKRWRLGAALVVVAVPIGFLVRPLGLAALLGDTPRSPRGAQHDR